MEYKTGHFHTLRFFPSTFEFDDEDNLCHHYEEKTYVQEYLDDSGKQHLQEFMKLQNLETSDFYLSGTDNAVKNLLDFLMKFKKVFKHSTWLSFNGSRYDTQLIL